MRWTPSFLNNTAVRLELMAAELRRAARMPAGERDRAAAEALAYIAWVAGVVEQAREEGCPVINPSLG